MYLQQLRSSLLDQANWVPQNTVGLIQSLNGMINEAYTQIWFERPWLWNTRTYELSVYPDLDAATSLLWFTGQTDPTTTPLSVSAGTAKPVLFSNIFFWRYTDTVLTSDFYTRVDEEMLSQLIGAWIEVEGRDYQIVDILIVNVPMSTDVEFQFYVDKLFTGPYEVPTDGSFITFTDWTIKFKTYKLPEDLFEIQDVGFRDNRDTDSVRWGTVKGISQRDAQRLSLPYQLTSNLPLYYVPESLFPFATDGTDQFSVAQNVGVGTAFPTGKYYFAWERIDLASGATLGMSEPIDIVVTANNIESFTFTESRKMPQGQARRMLFGFKTEGNTKSDIKWTYAQNYMYSNNLSQTYFDGTSNILNPFFWKFSNDDRTLLFTDWGAMLNAVGPRNLGYRAPENVTNYIGPTVRKGITFFPRAQPSNFMINDPDGRPWKMESACTIRYSFRPQALKDDYDTPVIPPEMHHLIVRRALVILYNKNGNPAQANQQLNQYMSEIKTWAMRYSSERDTIARLNQSWGVGYSSYVGQPTVTSTLRTG